MLGRPYSFVNPPHRAPHEFYFIVVARAARCRRGSRRSSRAIRSGSARAPTAFSHRRGAAADALWCLSTGTGIGPFLSMLRTPDKQYVIVAAT